MADRSIIAVQNGQAFRGTYCYSGGAPDWNGTILLQHYRTADQVNELLDHGPMTTLGPTPHTPKGVSWFRDDVNAETVPHQSVTRHYRDRPGDERGEFPDFTGNNTDDFWSISFAHGPDYYYLLTEDGWYISCRAERDRPPEPLAHYLVQFLAELSAPETH